MPRQILLLILFFFLASLPGSVRAETIANGATTYLEVRISDAPYCSATTNYDGPPSDVAAWQFHTLGDGVVIPVTLHNTSAAARTYWFQCTYVSSDGQLNVYDVANVTVNPPVPATVNLSLSSNPIENVASKTVPNGGYTDLSFSASNASTCQILNSKDGVNFGVVTMTRQATFSYPWSGIGPIPYADWPNGIWWQLTCWDVAGVDTTVKTVHLTVSPPPTATASFTSTPSCSINPGLSACSTTVPTTFTFANVNSGVTLGDTTPGLYSTFSTSPGSFAGLYMNYGGGAFALYNGIFTDAQLKAQNPTPLITVFGTAFCGGGSSWNSGSGKCLCTGGQVVSSDGTTCVAPTTCSATTISGCTLNQGTAGNNTTGACGGGYTGSCTYSCGPTGNWTSVTTCTAPVTPFASFNANPSSCSILPNNSACTAVVTWTSSNTNSGITLADTGGGRYYDYPEGSQSSANVGGVFVPYSAGTYQIYNGRYANQSALTSAINGGQTSVISSVKTVTASCGGGSSWNSGSGKCLCTGGQVVSSDGTTCVAPTGHVVTFDGNGSTGGSMSSQTASAATALTANAYTRTGYSFTGWNTAANGSGTSYANGETYSFAADMTLYAQWSVNSGGEQLNFFNCTIPDGSNRCTSKPSWVSNPTSGVNYDLYNSATFITTSNAYYASSYTFNPFSGGSAAELVRTTANNGSNAVRLRRNGSSVDIATVVAVAQCGSSSSWDSTQGKCVANAPALPDLTVTDNVATSPVTNPVSAIAGQSTTLTGIVRNLGSAGTGSSFNNFIQIETGGYSGPNSGFPPYIDLPFTTDGPLAAGGSLTVSQTYQFTTVGNVYGARVCANEKDRNGPFDISESRTDNNCGPWTMITVIAGQTKLVVSDCIVPDGASTCLATPNSVANGPTTGYWYGVRNLTTGVSYGCDGMTTIFQNHNTNQNASSLWLTYDGTPGGKANTLQLCDSYTSALIDTEYPKANCGPSSSWNVAQGQCVSNAPSSCSGTTKPDNCVLQDTPNGSTSGACAPGYAGSCTYSCASGTWTYQSGSCTQQSAVLTAHGNSQTGSSIFINPGDSAYLQWTSTAANHCEGTGFSTGGATNNANLPLSPLAYSPNPYNYQLTCYDSPGTGGTSWSSTASVTVNSPSASITAAPSRVSPGGTVTVSWTANDVASCNIYQNGTLASWGTNLLPDSGHTVSGSHAGQVVTRQTTYKISCTPRTGSVIQNAYTVVNVTGTFSPF